jgi:hypothetical protein
VLTWPAHRLYLYAGLRWPKRLHKRHEENQFCRPKLDAGLCAVSVCESSPESLTDLFRRDSGADPCCLTSLLYTPRIRIVGAHCPTRSASWCLSSIFKISEAAIEAPATHKNPSEGSLAVCSSIARATGPSLCSLELVIQ